MLLSKPALPDLEGVISLTSLRESLRVGLQKVCKEFDDSAMLFIEDSLYEPMLKSYLGSPDMAIEELDLPITHARPLLATGMSASTITQAPLHTNVVFIVRNSPSVAQLVVQYILEIRRLWEKSRGHSSTTQQNFWISVYPEAGQVFQRILSAAGAGTCSKTSDLPLHYFPFDQDVLSMHRPSVLKELLTDNNPAILNETSQALLAFASQHGMPQRIQAVGHHSCIVADLFRSSLLELEAPAAPAALQRTTMAKWVIFDRCADLLTPLLSQLTLEGRLDELQNTAPRTGWLPAERDADTDTRVPSVKVLLHKSTPEWSAWRERHVQCLPELQAHTQVINQRRSNAGASESWTQANYLRYLQRPMQYLIKDMVDNLPPGGSLSERHAAEMQSLQRRGRREPLWGGITSNPADMLLRLVLDGASLVACLRRLILTVAMRGALTDNVFLECMTILVDAFGPQHLLTLTLLQAAGFITRKQNNVNADSDSSLAAMNQLLDRAEHNRKDSLQISSIIIDPEDSQQDPSGLPYGLYHPISTLLVRHALLTYIPQWMKKHLQACSKCQGRGDAAGVPGGAFASYGIMQHEDGRVPLPERQTHEVPHGQRAPQSQRGEPVKTVLLVMLGGCTLAEMTSLRAAVASLNLQAVILTTDIITGDRMVQSFIPPAAVLADADAAQTMSVL